MFKLLQKIVEYRYLALLCMIFCALYYNLFVDRALIELNIHVENESYFKIYWAPKGEPYLERDSIYVRVKPGQEKYSFRAIDLGRVERLRIDPIEYVGQCTIKKIVFKQSGLQTVALTSEADFSLLQPNSQVTQYRFNQNGFTFNSLGQDPFFEFRPKINKAPLDLLELSVRFLFVLVLISLIYFSSRHLAINLQFVPLCIASILILVTVMAVISKVNVHPDEYVHLRAAEYYSDHWLPPVVDDPDIRHTYSGYGVSRLNSHEIYYFIAGKLKNIFSLLQLPDYLVYRLINVMFLGIIFLYTIKSPETRLLAFPLLISPQLWYIFSYANSDAIGLFLSFFAGYQLMVKKSLLNQYLHQEEGCGKSITPVLIGILLCCLLLMKKNYLFFSIFLFLCMIAKLVWEEEKKDRKKIIKRLAAIIIIGLFLAGLRFGADYFVNGINRAEKVEQVMNMYADKAYSPKSNVQELNNSLFLKKKGYSLKYVAFEAHWFEKMFRSFMGVYGYSSLSAPAGYYALAKKVALALAAFFFLSVFIRSGPVNALLGVSLLGLSAILIFACLYHSWTSDFQAQGRYLFPIIPMLGILYYRSQKTVNYKLMTTIVSILFILSSYSFICIGILQTPKVVLP